MIYGHLSYTVGSAMMMCFYPCLRVFSVYCILLAQLVNIDLRYKFCIRSTNVLFNELQLDLLKHSINDKRNNLCFNQSTNNEIALSTYGRLLFWIWSYHIFYKYLRGKLLLIASSLGGSKSNNNVSLMGRVLAFFFIFWRISTRNLNEKWTLRN